MENSVYCVIPNWNGKDMLGACLDSLLQQTLKAQIVVVENGSNDGSAEYIKERYPQITLLEEPTNLGFAGGVNVGIRYALKQKADFVALFNNDATADKDWLKNLVDAAHKYPKAGIVTGKFIKKEANTLDSTGEMYSIWGLPYPRGRGEKLSDTYDTQNWVFGATGGASLYRAKMLQKIGLFDEDFFAYYEDVDLSFRAQLANWQVYYEPRALAYHTIGASSSKVKGFGTYQTFKNLPLIFWKNVPYGLWPTVFPRLFAIYWIFMLRAFGRGQGWAATKGHLKALVLLPKKLHQHRVINKLKAVPDSYIRSILVWDMPPQAQKAKTAFRSKLRKS